jgi:hypothetical protein
MCDSYPLITSSTKGGRIDNHGTADDFNQWITGIQSSAMQDRDGALLGLKHVPYILFNA